MTSESAKRPASPLLAAAEVSKRFRFIDCVKSRLVAFVVGPDRKTYQIHEDVMARISKPISAMLKGKMSEATEGKVVWDDVEPSVFDDLVEFAYTGTVLPAREYSMWRRSSDTSCERQEEMAKIRKFYIELTNAFSKKKAVVTPLNLFQTFLWTTMTNEHKSGTIETLEGYWSEGFIESIQDFSANEPHPLEDDYLGYRFSNAEEVLRPVSLYILADRYAVDVLQPFCLAKFTKALAMLPYKKVAETLFPIVREIWPNTTEKDDIRAVVLDFMVITMPTVIEKSNRKAMEQLFIEFPSLLRGLFFHIPDNIWGSPLKC